MRFSSYINKSKKVNKFIQKFRSILLDLPKSLKIIISILVDSFLCVLTTWISLYLRLGTFLLIEKHLVIPSFISILIAIPVFYFSGLYRTIFRYSGWPAMLTVSKSIFLYGFFFSFLITIVSFNNVPRTIGIIQPLLLFFAVGISRVVIRYWIGDLYKNRLQKSSLPKACQIDDQVPILFLLGKRPLCQLHQRSGIK